MTSPRDAEGSGRTMTNLPRDPDAVPAPPLPDPGDLPGRAVPYARQVHQLGRLLIRDGEAHRDLLVIRTWTVWHVVGHLLARDELAAEAIGVRAGPEPPGTPTPEPDPRRPDEIILNRTEMVHRRYQSWSLARLTSDWWEQAAALLRQIAEQGGAGTARPVTYLGFPLTAGDVLLDCALETWIHADDVRQAIGEPIPRPAPDDLRLIGDLYARMLVPALTGLIRSGLPVPHGMIHLILTGPGGGNWEVPVGDRPGRAATATHRAVPNAELSMDVVDFCQLVGGRLAPSQARHTGRGDTDLIRSALLTAAGLARP
jgi:hypothetical protein